MSEKNGAIKNVSQVEDQEVSSRETQQIGPVSKGDVDDTTVFYNLHKDEVAPLDEAGSRRLTRKNFWFLLCQTWWIAFLIHLDKSTLSQASVMGIFKDVQMTKNEYNELFVIFYAGYLIALWPGAIIAQRVGHKHFITVSLFLWALLLGMHPLAKTGKQLMGLRFLLGMTESQIVPSATVLHQSFFSPKKSSWVQLLWWASGSFANVLLTMVAYKLILDDESGMLVGNLRSWKWLHIICVILTFVVCVFLIVFLPNSPVDAKWLSVEEKVHTIKMIRDTHSGISNSKFKWSQVKECAMDPKTWLFIFHMFFNELPNNTSQQLPLLIVGFDFTPAQSALFNIAKPIWGSILIVASAALLYATDIGIGFTCAISYVPCFVGGLMMVTLPFSNKIGLVVGTQISTFKPSYLLGLSWAGLTTTGYTKKMFVMSSCIVSAAVANMISPEFWQEKYKPRYILPWSFMTAFWFVSPAMCLVIRFYLNRENKKRAEKMAETRKSGQAKEGVLDTGDGMLRIEEDDLDQTDRQNLRFVYPL